MLSDETPVSSASSNGLLRTPLHALHAELGARMAPFAGYEMPISYPAGILAEHRHTRAAASLFDVSHMGQIRLGGEGAAAALESLVPADIVGLPSGKQRYGFFTNSSAGIVDDLMITRRHWSDGAAPDDLLLVVNAAARKSDLAHLTTNIGHRCTIQALDDRALLALQGPEASAVLASINPAVDELAFMSGGWFKLVKVDCFITRSGYTGEDGFEMSMPVQHAEMLARALMDDHRVLPAGLGARDTLRLEAGLCLHGHDISVSTTPAEAGLGWAVSKVRRTGGARAGGYPGADVLDSQLARGTVVKRVGLVGLERIPVREGAKLIDIQGRLLGHVTSGTIGPTVNRPIAMAYLAANHGAIGGEVYAEIRNHRLPMRIEPMPFITHRYRR
ncbi:glycine cleavage system aminomethyltransferase GcvT [soil metagenome]